MNTWQGEYYHGVRMVVNGELIDHYAYEFGDDSLEVAKQYDAEPFDALLDAKVQHWIEHHNRVFSNTAKVLERENAELRELVRIMYYCHLPWKDCDKCAMNGADMHVEISDVEFCDGMHDRMRELGIEVDG